MNFRARFKSHTADRVLLPLRMELVDRIQPNSRVLEVGCGTGSLLRLAATKISSGLGVDVDPAMIRYAESKRRKHNLSNLKFECIDALDMAPSKYNVSTSTLCLHEMPAHKAYELLKLMVDQAEVALVADYTRAKTALSRLSIECDEVMSGHYGHFRRYRKNGEIPMLARKIGAVIDEEIPSVVDGISIWILSKNNRG